jgi:hypothetical protein
MMLCAACGGQVDPSDVEFANPFVRDYCDRLTEVRAGERPGGELPQEFPLPEGAEVAGTKDGDPPAVRVTAPGDFLELDSFFKSELADRGWAGESSGNGSGPTGSYGWSGIHGHGYEGRVAVVQCDGDAPEILVEIAPES